MEELSIREIHKLMSEGKLTAVELVSSYIQRIKDLDKKLNSVIELNPDALKIARQLDELFQEKGIVGSLHGIPVLIKDNIDTGDKMVTSAGSLALKNHHAKEDAFVITRLRKNGAIILGKTNLSEWANFRGQRSSSGWSSRGGQTRNPYDLARTPCGSSSGSAVAVAANLCVVAIGTETDGSILCPSSINGIVGIKPSIGLVSRTGIIPISHTQDTAGPMGKNVQDVAITLNAIIGKDEKDPTTLGEQLSIPNIENSVLENIGIGVLRGHSNFSPKVMKLFEKAITKISGAGAKIVDPVNLKIPEGIGNAELTVLHYDFKEDLNQYLASHDTGFRNLSDIIQFNKENEDTVMPHFGQEHMEAAASKGDLKSEEYLHALETYSKFKQNVDDAFEENNVDILISPSTGPAWLIDHINGDNHGGGSSSFITAITGYCAITVPMGYVSGLPVGLSFIGQHMKDVDILKVAYAYEQMSKVRTPPLLPT